MSSRNGGQMATALEDVYTPVVGNVVFTSHPIIDAAAYGQKALTIKTEFISLNPATCERTLVRPILAKTSFLTSDVAIGIFDAPVQRCKLGNSEPVDRTLSTAVLSNNWIPATVLRISAVADIMHEVFLPAVDAVAIRIASAPTLAPPTLNAFPYGTRTPANISIKATVAPFVTKNVELQTATVISIVANNPDAVVEVSGISAEVQALITINAEVTPQTT